MASSSQLRASVSAFGWELIDEFGSDLQIELQELDGNKIQLRIVDYSERTMRDDEREYMDVMVKSWLDDNLTCDAEVSDDRHLFEFQMTAWET